MFPLRPIAGFFVRCALIYLLLVAPLPGLKDGYRAVFRWAGNAIFYSFGGDGSVYFEPLSRADHVRDTRLRLVNRRTGNSGSMDFKCVYTGYRPTAFLIALVLATPIPWSRRGWALIWGLLGVSLFVAVRVWLRLLDAFSNGDVLALYTFSSFAKAALGNLIKVLVRSPEMSYIIPAFIWILVAFRRGDRATVFSSTGLRRGANARS